MNCHNEKDNNVHNNEKHKHHNHGLIMLVACLLPIVLIFILKTIYPESTAWSYLFILICPLLHIVMLIGFFKKSKK